MKTANPHQKFSSMTNDEKEQLKQRNGKTVIGHAKNGKSEVYFYSDGTKEEING